MIPTKATDGSVHPVNNPEEETLMVIDSSIERISF